MLDVLSLLALLGWLFLTFFHGQFWRPLLDKDAAAPAQWPSVDIIVPARNEADVLPESLPSLLTQDYEGPWRLILVNDHSTDSTVATAKILAQRANTPDRLIIVNAPALEKGWQGKVAAMNTGVAESQADFLLFTDADIRHDTASLRRLVTQAEEAKLDLVSLMVKLNVRAVAEKLMIPAFVFFFAMLYPFRRANNPQSKVAAAAGGVMLVRRETLTRAGGLAAIKGALIDDCALARLLKNNGATTQLTLTQNVISLRAYPTLEDIRDMVARAAFYQLRHSWALLTGTVLGLGLLFLVPLVSALFFNPAGSVALAFMIGIYVPMVRFYGLFPAWAATLPFAAIFYIVTTIDSARRHVRGQGGLWKGRIGTS